MAHKHYFSSFSSTKNQIFAKKVLFSMKVSHRKAFWPKTQRSVSAGPIYWIIPLFVIMSKLSAQKAINPSPTYFQRKRAHFFFSRIRNWTWKILNKIENLSPSSRSNSVKKKSKQREFRRESVQVRNFWPKRENKWKKIGKRRNSSSKKKTNW